MFRNLQKLSLDPTFLTYSEYLADKNPEKVNLGIGIYADLKGKPFVMPIVKKAFGEIDKDNFNYQPIGGNRDFLELTKELIFGKVEDLAMQSCCGGTQACRLITDLVLRAQGRRKLYIGVPTWVNHFAVFGGLDIEKFEHLKDVDEVDFEAYIKVIEQAEEKSVLVLQGGKTHNPSGLNLSLDQMRELADVINQKQILVYLDFAYIGLGDGFEKDCEYARVARNIFDHFAMGVSFSKNACLYELRTGILFVKCPNVQTVETQLQQICRESISMSPGLGQEIMMIILKNYQKEWLNEVEEMRLDINDRKKRLLAKLDEKFEYLAKCRGMFGMINLDLESIKRLRRDFGVYICDNGRVSFAGIEEKHIADIAKAFLKTV